MRGSARGSARIDAPPDRVYAILADYKEHHPRIVPREYFKAIHVEAGGIGAGTRLRVEMQVLGNHVTVRHVVSEPEPGRVLVEADAGGATTTTFTVDALDAGRATQLTIVTDFETQRNGIAGNMERVMTRWMLQRIYRKELALIDQYARAMGR